MAEKRVTVDNGIITSMASKINYDNTDSGLDSTNVQSAIDEINSNLTQSGALYHHDLTLNGVSSTYTAHVERTGNVVNLVISTIDAITKTAPWVSVNIPNGYRPHGNYAGYSYDSTVSPPKLVANTIYASAEGNYTKGDVVCWANLSTNRYRMLATFFTADDYPTADLVVAN